MSDPSYWIEGQGADRHLRAAPWSSCGYSRSIIVPCPAEMAWLWALGQVGDEDILHSSRKTGDALLFADLPDLAAFRDGAALMRKLFDEGCRLAIFRTKTPSVEHHARKWGSLQTFTEPEAAGGKSRWIILPGEFARYARRLRGSRDIGRVLNPPYKPTWREDFEAKYGKIADLPHFGTIDQNSAAAAGVTKAR